MNADTIPTTTTESRPARDAAECRVEARKEIHARVDHRGGVDECGDRGGRLHGVREPRLERELRRLGCRGRKESEADPCQQQRRKAVRLRQEGGNIEASVLRVDGEGPGEQARATQAGDDERLDAARNRLRIVVVERDEGPRAQRRDLPEDDHHQEVGGEHQADHGPDEEEHQRVVAALSFLPAHVVDGEHHRQTADHRRHRRQEDPECVREKAELSEHSARWRARSRSRPTQTG